MSMAQFRNQRETIQNILKCNGYRLLAYYPEYGMDTLYIAFYQSLDKSPQVYSKCSDIRHQKQEFIRSSSMQGARSHFTAAYRNDPDRIVFATPQDEALKILLVSEEKTPKASF